MTITMMFTAASDARSQDFGKERYAKDKNRYNKEQWKKQYGKSLPKKEFKTKGQKTTANFSWDSLTGKPKLQMVRPTEPVRSASGTTINRSLYSPVSPYRKRSIDRVTIDLPEKYVELDSDLDGQIGLYEWVVERREDVVIFDAIDANGDGLLTPRELHGYETTIAAADQEPTPRTYERPRLQVIGGTYHLTAKGKAPTREQLPEAYNPGRGRSREESHHLHQSYVDRRMAQLTPQQKARISQLWKQKQQNDPDMKNRGASFVQIMEYVAENEK